MCLVLEMFILVPTSMHSFTHSITRTKNNLLRWEEMNISLIEEEIKNMSKKSFPWKT